MVVVNYWFNCGHAAFLFSGHQKNIAYTEAMRLEEKILTTYKTIAIIGLSPDNTRPSYKVASHLKEHGYRVIPVNPGTNQILGVTSYPDLTSIPDPIDVVDIFRRSEEIPPIVEDAIQIGAKVIWMQLGISNEKAAARAKEAGLIVVMNRCMRKEHLKLMKKKQT